MKVIIHKGLDFRNEEEQYLNQIKNVLTKEIGSVTSDSTMTFEYKLKEIEELEKAKDFDISKLEQLPFQTQIEFTKLDGFKCIRVITKVQEVSHDRKEVEKDANADILGVNCVQQAARLARRGSFRKAQAYMQGQKVYWGSNENEEAQQEINSNLNQMNSMYGMLQIQNNLEEAEYLSDCDDVMDDKPTKPSSSINKMKEGGNKKYKSRFTDKMSSEVHNFARFNKKK